MHSSQVAYLFVLETANTGLDIGIMYQPLILEYGKPVLGVDDWRVSRMTT